MHPGGTRFRDGQVISSDEEEEAKQQSASPARATRARPGSLGRHPASPATPGPSAPSGPKRSSSRPSALRKRSTSQAPPTSTRLCSPGVSPEHSSPQPPASPVSVDPLLQSPASKGRPRWRDGVIKVAARTVLKHSVFLLAVSDMSQRDSLIMGTEAATRDLHLTLVAVPRTRHGHMLLYLLLERTRSMLHDRF